LEEATDLSKDTLQNDDDTQGVQLNSKEILVWYTHSNVQAIYLTHWMACGMTVKRTGMVARVRMMKALTVKRGTLTENKGGESRTDW
jgi:hypothetical protein